MFKSRFVNSRSVYIIRTVSCLKMENQDHIFLQNEETRFSRAIQKTMLFFAGLLNLSLHFWTKDGSFLDPPKWRTRYVDLKQVAVLLNLNRFSRGAKYNIVLVALLNLVSSFWGQETVLIVYDYYTLLWWLFMLLLVVLSLFALTSVWLTCWTCDSMLGLGLRWFAWD